MKVVWSCGTAAVVGLLVGLFIEPYMAWDPVRYAHAIAEVDLAKRRSLVVDVQCLAQGNAKVLRVANRSTQNIGHCSLRFRRVVIRTGRGREVFAGPDDNIRDLEVSCGREPATFSMPLWMAIVSSSARAAGYLQSRLSEPFIAEDFEAALIYHTEFGTEALLQLPRVSCARGFLFPN